MYEREERMAREVLGGMAEQGGVRLDDKLDRAIMTGLADGKSKERRKRRSFRPFAAWGMALAALLLVGLPWAADFIPGKGVTGNHTGSEVIDRQGTWGAFEAYRSVANDHLSLRSALDAGYVQPVNAVSEEINGYRLRIDGLVADRKGLLALATIDNDSPYDIQSVHVMLKQTDGEGVLFTSYSGWSSDTMGKAGGNTPFIIDLQWNDKLRNPDNYILELIIFPDPQQVSPELHRSGYHTEMEMAFDVPEEAFHPGELVSVNDYMEIEGQKIKVSEAYLGVTGNYVDYAYDGENSMQIFKLIQPSLQINGGNSSPLQLKQFADLKGLGTLAFQSDNSYEGPVSFRIEGYEALERNKMELVIDMDRGEVLKAPIEGFVFIEPSGDDSDDVLRIHVPRTSLDRSGLSLSSYYTDGEGNSFSIEGISGRSVKDNEFSPPSTDLQYEIRLGQENLPQPLTFTITGYGNAVTGNGSVRIR